MAEPEKKPQTDQRAAQPAQQSAPTQPAAEKREYVAKHKIRMGGRDARKVLAAGAELRLTEEEAARLGDAVEPKR